MTKRSLIQVNIFLETFYAQTRPRLPRRFCQSIGLVTIFLFYVGPGLHVKSDCTKADCTQECHLFISTKYPRLVRPLSNHTPFNYYLYKMSKKWHIWNPLLRAIQIRPSSPHQ